MMLSPSASSGEASHHEAYDCLQRAGAGGWEQYRRASEAVPRLVRPETQQRQVGYRGRQIV